MNGGWIETAATVITRREPKTPMEFYSRVLWTIMALIIAPPFSPIPSPFKIVFLSLAVMLLAILGIFVSYLVVKKPENLLYGAETHFEKWKAVYSDKGATPQHGDPVIT
jgi:hypothetical protein